METKSRRTFSGRKGIEAGSSEQRGRTKGAEYNNLRRRKLYANDPNYAERVKKAARETYRKEHPLGPRKLENGLLENGELKEVFTDEMDHPVCVETFTVPQAARALGRSELAFKRWITDGLIPPPILKDTVRRYMHYSLGELRTIARVLRDHEDEFKYFTAKHTGTIEVMWQAMHGYRATKV